MLGYDIRVERIGPDGTSDRLSDVEIRNADVVILATDQPDDQDRFQGKSVRRATPSEAIRHTARLLREAAGDRELPKVAELASPGTVPLQPTPVAPRRHLPAPFPAHPATRPLSLPGQHRRPSRRRRSGSSRSRRARRASPTPSWRRKR
nr:hypothetical protein [Skermanella pratensis]